MDPITLKYGKSEIRFFLPFAWSVDMFSPTDTAPAENPEDLVVKSLQDSIDFNLNSCVNSTISVSIAINDKTRPVPNDILIPPLLNRLLELGVQKENISLIVANGTHTPMKPEEYDLILPRTIIDQYRVFSHNCDDMENLISIGMTSRGTPVLGNRRFYESDLKIVTGNIEPHHFMGFSGGAKSASIGLAGRPTITGNHSLLLDPMACAGEFENNPMRQEVEEIGNIIGVQFALNAILNNEKKIIRVLAGNPSSVIRKGVEIVRDLCQTKVPHFYDVVIASAGGYPKDINLYQAQKAITNSARIVKDGGTVILAAECIEGIGSASFEQFMKDVATVDQIIAKFNQQGFQVGPHKALQIALIAKRVSIILVSSIHPDLIKKYMLIPAQSIEEALTIATQGTSPAPQVALLPMAVTTIPVINLLQ